MSWLPRSELPKQPGHYLCRGPGSGAAENKIVYQCHFWAPVNEQLPGREPDGWRNFGIDFDEWQTMPIPSEFRFHVEEEPKPNAQQMTIFQIHIDVDSKHYGQFVPESGLSLRLVADRIDLHRMLPLINELKRRLES